MQTASRKKKKEKRTSELKPSPLKNLRVRNVDRSTCTCSRWCGPISWRLERTCALLIGGKGLAFRSTWVHPLLKMKRKKEGKSKKEICAHWAEDNDFIKAHTQKDLHTHFYYGEQPICVTVCAWMSGVWILRTCARIYMERSRRDTHASEGVTAFACKRASRPDTQTRKPMKRSHAGDPRWFKSVSCHAASDTFVSAMKVRDVAKDLL